MKQNLFGLFIVALLLTSLVHATGMTNKIHFVENTSDLDEVRAAIRNADAKWIADYTSISNSSHCCYALCNHLVEEHTDVFDDNDTVSITYSLPDEFDWRNVNGTDWTTSIKHQGNCGSCVAFAAVAALESTIQIEIGQHFECDLSEAHLFFCGGGGCNWGWHVGSAANFISSVGVADELCFPYNPWDMDCDEKESNWMSRTVSASHKRFTTNSMVKQALVEYGSVVTAMAVYEDFRYYTGGIYEHVSGGYRGGHAVTIIGYNDIDGYWIGKNSWGEFWGEKNPYDDESRGGWFRIKYDDSSIGSGGFYAFYDIVGNLHPSEPIVVNPSDKESNLEPKDISLQWFCFDPDGDELIFTIYFAERLGAVRPTEEYMIAERISDTFYHIDNLDLKKDSRYSWIVVAEDKHGSKSMSDMFSFATRKLYKPSVEGPSGIMRGEEYTFFASTPETDGEEYYWFFDWGDGQDSGWLGPYGPDDMVSQSHTWDKRGDVTVRVRYQEDGIYSDFFTMNLPVRRSQGIGSWFYRLFEGYPYLFFLLHQLFNP